MSSPPDATEPIGAVDPTAPPLEAENLRKVFSLGDGSELAVLAGVDLRIVKGEAVSIVGTSGAGKSTLLHLLGALDRPTSGTIRLGGVDVDGRPADEISGIRNRFVGFVFQFHHLLREFSAIENVMMPRLIRGSPRSEARRLARELLDAVGLTARENHKPWQLSGGEQQRVAVARALVNEPVILLADEPSGNLDDRTSQGLHDLLFRLRDDRDLAMILVTHNVELAGRADRTLQLTDGVLSAVADSA